MPAAVTFVRATLTDSDTLNAAAFNALTAPSATVPDAAAGSAGVMPATTTAAGLALTNAADALAQRTVLDLVIGTNVQAYNANLTAISGLAANGLIARTSASTAAARTLTGTAAEITVTNGDGVAGNPTLSLPAALTFTGKTVTGGTFASPTLGTPILGTPQSGTLTSCTGLPISTGVSGLGTGIATALAVNVGTAGAPVVNGGALGTPSSGTVTNLTGTASININGTVGATTPSTVAATTATASVKLGAGISTPGTVLHVLSGSNNNIADDVSEGRIIGANKALTGEQANLVIQSNDAMAADMGGSIAFGGRAITASTNGNNFAHIAGRKANGTTGNYEGYLVFGVSDAASDISEKMRLTSTGLNSTAIGATTPSTGAFTTITASGKVATGGTANTRNLNVGNASSAYTELAIRSSAASTVAGGATLYFANATDDDEGWLNYDNAARTLTTRVAKTTVGTWSSTGLAVTGALSATGAINNTATGGVFTTSGATTNARYASFQSTGANFVVGSDNSAGTAFITGGSAYSGVIATQNAASVFIGVNSAKVAEFSSTGLAVTGALSSTTGANFATSSGDVVIGNATAAAKLHIQADFSSSYGATVRTTSNASNANLIQFVKDAAGSPNEVGNITYTNATNLTNYNTTSDARLKDNVRELTNSGNIIDGLRPVLHDWKTGQKNIIGFIAQEVFAVFPQAVSKGDDDLETVTQQWSMDASKLVPVLVAELKSLRARVAHLEAA